MLALLAVAVTASVVIAVGSTSAPKQMTERFRLAGVGA